MNSARSSFRMCKVRACSILDMRMMCGDVDAGIDAGVVYVYTTIQG